MNDPIVAWLAIIILFLKYKESWKKLISKEKAKIMEKFILYRA